MVCDDVKKIAYFFLDETLGPKKRDQVVSHLRRCSPCADFVSILKRLRAFVRNRLPKIVAPNALRERISRSMSRTTASS